MRIRSKFYVNLEQEFSMMQPINSFLVLFAMAKIRRIGHDHHTPFRMDLVVLTNQAVTRGENKLPHD